MDTNESVNRLHSNQAAGCKVDSFLPRDKLIRIQFKHEDLPQVRVRVQKHNLVLDRAQQELVLLTSVVLFFFTSNFLQLFALVSVLLDMADLLDDAQVFKRHVVSHQKLALIDLALEVALKLIK